jgi:hypothetical protein
VALHLIKNSVLKRMLLQRGLKLILGEQKCANTCRCFKCRIRQLGGGSVRFAQGCEPKRPHCLQ